MKLSAMYKIDDRITAEYEITRKGGVLIRPDGTVERILDSNHNEIQDDALKAEIEAAIRQDSNFRRIQQEQG